MSGFHHALARWRVIFAMLVTIPGLDMFAAGAAQAQACAGQTGQCTIDQAQFGNSPATAPIGNNTAQPLIVGNSSTGVLAIQNGATVTTGSVGSSVIGSLSGSSGMVTVSGPGSAWNGTDLVIGSNGTGTLTIENGATITNSGVGVIGSNSSSSGTVTVSGPGSAWNVTSTLLVGLSGTGTLTIANGATVNAAGLFLVTSSAAGRGTVNIGAPAGAPPAAPGTLNTSSVAFGAGAGLIVFNHTSGNYHFAPAISGPGAVEVLSGNTVMDGLSTYSGPTTIAGGILSAGAPGAFSPNSNYTVLTGGELNLNGFSQTVAGVSNAGLIQMGAGTPPGTTLTTVNYVGAGGTIAMNTFLGSDGSPSDKLVINGGTATGSSFIHITNAGGPGTETTGNGILVVDAINGATTAPGAFTLGNAELRAGAYDYRLFQGGLGGGDPNDWFLRSTFVVGPPPLPGQPEPEPFPPGVLPPEPPVGPLPPGQFPIIGPEIATYGAVQPIARELGFASVATLHERFGDSVEGACCCVATTSCCTTPSGATAAQATVVQSGGCRPAVWGRVFGQSIDNRYQQFADPTATGQIVGIQTGADLWRGSLIAGHTDTAGVYFAYGNASVDVSGLVTNAAATGYVNAHTGKVGLNAWSGGAYWTHYGPGGWYVDAVVQGTGYSGDASTLFANLPLNGSGVVTSLEAGYPIPLPWFGPRFVLEPQGQIIWQQVSFSDANDGLGPVSLGTTSGTTGRAGLRGRWTVDGAYGIVWQPYVQANIWRDWGGEATTMFGPDQVPLIEQATRLEFAGGLTAKLGPRLSFYLQGGYQFATDESGPNPFRRDSAKGDFGFRYSW